VAVHLNFRIKDWKNDETEYNIESGKFRKKRKYLEEDFRKHEN
jgi:hypothetical protein